MIKNQGRIARTLRFKSLQRRSVDTERPTISSCRDVATEYEQISVSSKYFRGHLNRHVLPILSVHSRTAAYITQGEVNRWSRARPRPWASGAPFARFPRSESLQAPLDGCRSDQARTRVSDGRLQDQQPRSGPGRPVKSAQGLPRLTQALRSGGGNGIPYRSAETRQRTLGRQVDRLDRSGERVEPVVDHRRVRPGP